MYLSASLKSHGHETDFFDIGIEETVKEYVEATRPDIIGYSIFTGSHRPMFEVNRQLKEVHDFFSVFGGPHATYFPESIEEEGVDAVCRGEAEEALTELADRLEAGKDVTDVENFWVKRGGNIYKNEPRNLCEDLDTLPHPDRSLLRRYPQYANFGPKHIITSRGCPFSCSYCYNSALRELYKGKGRRLRRRSVDDVMTEMKEIVAHGNVPVIHISDDTFITDGKWLLEFADRYEPIAVPVSCFARVEYISTEAADALRRIRCAGVHVGVETADEEMRKKLLHRKMGNGIYENVARVLADHGVPLVTHNILGLPGESVEGALETLRFNAKLKPAFAAVSIYQPYPGTELGRIAEEKGLVAKGNPEFPTRFWQKSVLTMPRKTEFENLAQLFSFAVKFSPIIPVVERLIRFRNNALFDLIGASFKCYVFLFRLGYLRFRDIWCWAGRRTFKAKP
jgi:radical SAM superfamily enzyme YgiQ (UPF0313 family)